MKQVYRYCDKGTFVEPVIIGDDEEIPCDCTDKELPQPNWKPVFINGDWVETITPEELTTIKQPPLPVVSLEDRVSILEDQVAALMAQLNKTS